MVEEKEKKMLRKRDFVCVLIAAVAIHLVGCASCSAQNDKTGPSNFDMTQPSQESLLDAEQTREPHPLQHHSVHDLRSIFAIGDLHGDADCGKFWVEKTGLVQHNEDNQWNWIGDDHSVLIFMGDYIDRGPQSREVLRMVKELTEAFPDRVVALLGNHEMHYLWDRTRYQDEFFQYPYSVVHPEEFFLWVNATRAEREEADSELLPPLFSALKVVYDSPRFMRMANMANIHHLVEKMTRSLCVSIVSYLLFSRCYVPFAVG
mmetsp:Transcript_13764/g.26692  ORF Transcript_13764/g.26692 Transcript_13764/m.26692 type:complete len:261 (-) Transcript_13764:86-868(-)